MEMEKLFSVLLFSSLPERLVKFVRENGGKIRKGKKNPQNLLRLNFLMDISVYMAGPGEIKQICRCGTCGCILVVVLAVVGNCLIWWSLRAFPTLIIL